MHRQKSDLPVSSFLSSGMWKYFGTCHSIHNLLEHGSYGLHMVFHVWCDMSWTITEHLVRIGTHGLFPGPIVCHSSMTKGCPTRIREFSVILALHVDWIDCSHTPLKSNFWGHETPRWGGTPVLDALNHVESLICSVLGFKVLLLSNLQSLPPESFTTTSRAADNREWPNVMVIPHCFCSLKHQKLMVVLKPFGWLSLYGSNMFKPFLTCVLTGVLTGRVFCAYPSRKPKRLEVEISTADHALHGADPSHLADYAMWMVKNVVLTLPTEGESKITQVIRISIAIHPWKQIDRPQGYQFHLDKKS